MSAGETLLLAYLMNAAWQFPLLAGMAALLLRVLREPTPRLEFAVWGVTAGVGSLVPLAVVAGLAGPGEMRTDPPSAMMQVPGWAWRVLLGTAGSMALVRLAALVRAGVAAWKLRRRSRPLGVEEGVEIREMPVEWESAGPLLVGVWRPAILVPRFLMKPEHEPLWRMALAHELAHVARRDLAVMVLTEALLLPLAFHPLSRWLREKLEAARELACDAQASGDAIGYARCLLEIAKLAVQPSTPVAALGVGGAQILERRIRALAEPPTRMLSRGERLAAALLLLVLAAVLSDVARSTFVRLSSVPAPAMKGAKRYPPPPPAPPEPKGKR